MAYALRSEVRKRVNVQQYKMIIATDGLIGEKCKSRNIEVLLEKGGSFEEVCDLVEDRVKVENIKPVVLISAGNTNVSLRYWGLNPGLIKGREEVTKKELIEDLVGKLRTCQEKMINLGALVVFATLIPNPKEQMMLENENIKLTSVKKVMQEIYAQVNNEIIELNREAGFTTPNLKTYVTRTGKKTKREVTLVRPGCYSPRNTTPKPRIQEKMMGCCEHALQYIVNKQAP